SVNADMHLRRELTFMILFSCAGYFVTISQITPYQSDRYISPIFPLLILLTIIVINSLLTRVKISSQFQLYILVSLALASFVLTITSDDVNYLYTDSNKESIQNILNEEQVRGVLIYDKRRVRGAQVTKAAQDLVKHEESFILNTQD